MTARPTELRKLVEVLNQDFDSAEMAAKAAFEAVEQMIAERNNYVVFVHHKDTTGNVLLQSFGVFTTRAQAEKAIASGKIYSPGGTIVSKGAIAQLTMIN
jgi:hypothetical protein